MADSNYGFDPNLPPDIAEAALGEQRKRRVYEALLGQSLQQPQGRMVGRFYAPPSPVQGLSNLAGMYAATSGMKESDKALAGLGGRYREGLLNAVKQYYAAKRGEPIVATEGAQGPTQETIPSGAQPTVPFEKDDPRIFASQFPYPELSKIAEQDYEEQLKLREPYTLGPQAQRFVGGSPTPVAENPNVRSGTTINLPPMEKYFDKKLGEIDAEELGKGRDAATEAVAIIYTINEGRKLLDSPMITGFGADYIVQFGQALKQAGFDVGGDALANTQAYAANMAQNVGKVIKQFGSGTGLSDADREYAEKMVAGKITLDRDAMRKILDINEKAARNVIQLQNKRAQGIKSKIPLTVEMPPSYAPQEAPKQAIPLDEYLKMQEGQ